MKTPDCASTDSEFRLFFTCRKASHLRYFAGQADKKWISLLIWAGRIRAVSGRISMTGTPTTLSATRLRFGRRAAREASTLSRSSSQTHVKSRLPASRLYRLIVLCLGVGLPEGVLLLLALGYVADGHGDLGASVLTGGERAEADFHSDDGSILTAGPEFTSGAHFAGYRRPLEGLSECRMVGASVFGHEHLYGLPDEFIAGVAEDLFASRIGQADYSVSVGHH
jgi:hypothetical protein